jgi:ribosomal protein S27E
MEEKHISDLEIRCITCGDTKFEFKEDYSWIKCVRCGKEYLGGKDELIELNQENIDNAIDENKEEILKEAKKEISEMLKKSFKGNKFLKFK